MNGCALRCGSRASAYNEEYFMNHSLEYRCCIGCGRIEHRRLQLLPNSMATKSITKMRGALPQLGNTAGFDAAGCRRQLCGTGYQSSRRSNVFRLIAERCAQPGARRRRRYCRRKPMRGVERAGTQRWLVVKADPKSVWNIARDLGEQRLHHRHRRSGGRGHGNRLDRQPR